MKHEIPVGRRRFLQGAAVGAAALVAKSAPSLEAETEQAAAAAPPAAPPPTQLAADTDPPPRRTSARIVEHPASDFMVDVIKSLGFEYAAANPGSSFEGLHESIINYGGNAQPGLLTCCHDESSAANALSYAKIISRTMPDIVHGNIVVHQASLAIY